MDLMTMNRKDFLPGKLVEGWSTLIWTERFQDPGEIELHTPFIADTRRLLPELSLCTLRDTNEVIEIQSHEIAINQTDGSTELVVRGKTIDDFLRWRKWSGAEYGKKTKMHQNYTVRQAVEVWVWNALVNDTGNDVVNTAISRAVGNAIPNVVVSDSVPAASDGSSGPRKVQNGDCYSQMRAFLSSGKLGIRNIRPNGTKGKRVDVASNGDFSTTHVDPFLKLRMDIYQGRDLTDKVVFSYKADDLVSPSYLFSSESFGSGAFVDGDPRTSYVTNPDALPGTNSGWNRRDVYVDGGSKDTGTTADDFESSLSDLGLKTLRHDNKHVQLITFQISPLSSHKYNRDYRLGDRVTVQGDYGIRKTMWVTEYVRTEDSTGEAGYPTLNDTPS